MANANAVAGPSKRPSPKVEPASPEDDDDLKEVSAGTRAAWGSDDIGETTKIPAFLNKLFS